MMMTKSVAEWVTSLNMKTHPEGGYFREIEKSHDKIQIDGKERSLFTSIYFLLEKENPSHFHRLTADEIWYYHEGQPLTVHMITPEGTYEKVLLGKDMSKNEVLQYRVPKGTIFGSTVEEGFALVSCMVSPGFEFEDFELFSREELLAQYPEYEVIIKQLTK
ncbi:cupin domain-containing protein [Streptococcus sp. CSL10205-OR2]|uniref:cupin domain-containing protein n=1 Tax=Streptococcus sp. CSL10205-OR2 TaxID=2980558 RepID=UPI0021D928E0|nr:cupin domain-containing protein [Streptococcus sp. CSL10205-OR2]MCU9534395.1 cupin domain-containing protein [Streptococcus sp. CSL10205-OR2]